MPDNPFVEKRRRDKEKLLKLVQTNPDMDEDKLIGIFSQQTGYTKATIGRMLEELQDAGLI